MDGPFDNFAVALGQNLHFYAFFSQKVEKLTTDLGQFSKVFVFAKKEAFSPIILIGSHFQSVRNLLDICGCHMLL